MSPGILIDISHQTTHYFLPANLDSLQLKSKHLPGISGFIHITFCIRVEKQGKWVVGVSVYLLFHVDQKVKMVVKDAICPGVGYRNNMPFVEFQEELIVLLFRKKWIPVFCPVVNGIKFPRLQNNGFHSVF